MPADLEARARKLADEWDGYTRWMPETREDRVSALAVLLLRMAAPGEAAYEVLHDEVDRVVPCKTYLHDAGKWARAALERARQAREEAERG